MTIRGYLGDALRNKLARKGYVLWKRSHQRLGIWPLVDVKRLAGRSGVPIRTVFDVGANVGQFAREALREFDGALVHSFEPHPKTFAELSGRLSGERIRPVLLALGEFVGNATMFEFRQDGGKINSLVPNAHYHQIFAGEAHQIIVPCSTLDAYCADADIATIDLLKVDTEGFDLEVLKGARGMLSEGRVRFVYVEFNVICAEAGVRGGALSPIAEFLQPFGFHFIASYNDLIVHEPCFLGVFNALFERQASAGT